MDYEYYIQDFLLENSLRKAVLIQYVDSNYTKNVSDYFNDKYNTLEIDQGLLVIGPETKLSKTQIRKFKNSEYKDSDIGNLLGFDCSFNLEHRYSVRIIVKSLNNPYEKANILSMTCIRRPSKKHWDRIVKKWNKYLKKISANAYLEIKRHYSNSEMIESIVSGVGYDFNDVNEVTSDFNDVNDVTSDFNDVNEVTSDFNDVNDVTSDFNVNHDIGISIIKWFEEMIPGSHRISLSVLEQSPEDLIFLLENTSLYSSEKDIKKAHDYLVKNGFIEYDSYDEIY